MRHVLQIVFVLACASGVGFWAYSIVPFLRLQAQLGRRGGHVAPSRLILKDRAHPLHKDARRLAGAVLGFVLCWLVAALVGIVSAALRTPVR